MGRSLVPTAANLCGVSLALLAGGCASSGWLGSSESSKPVSAGQFVAGSSDAAQSQSGGEASVPDRSAEFPVIPVEKAREGISDVVVIEGAPAPLTPAELASTPATTTDGSAASAAASTPPASAPAEKRSIAVDKSVGQINGRPIYASEFLKDMDDRLIRNAERMKRPEWVRETYKLVGEKLRDEMRDELLLSEFNTTLKPEQKAGVASFLTKVQEDLRSGNLGSDTLANKRLLESEGKTVEQKARDISDKAFIQDLLRRRVYGTVQVSAREVRRYYENNPAEFKEPGLAVFRIIQAPANDADRVTRIESALNSGEAFIDVAARESAWRRDQKESRFTLEVKFTDEYAESDFFGPAALNEAARALTPGSRTQRVNAGGSAWWVLLDSVSPPRTVPFYEAQLAIERKLKNERYREEESRYFDKLLRRSSATTLDEMALKITEFADQRYWGESRVSTPPANVPPAAGVR